MQTDSEGKALMAAAFDLEATTGDAGGTVST
jgi:hypothetical protein